MSKYIHNLILQGENQHLDFKYCITDAKKIARSLSAFANTDGGKLLIGVKDNGSIAGIKEEEEYYMIESAADIFCSPPIKFESRNWTINGKHILEVTIPKSTKKPHLAKTDDGKWQVYVRVKDENVLANKVIVKVWGKERSKKGIKVDYSKTEQLLLNYLKKNGSISLSKFVKIAQIKRSVAENILANLIVWKVIAIHAEEDTIFYKLINN